MSRKPFDWAAIIAALLSLAGTIYIEATHTDAEDHKNAIALEHRITAVEDKTGSDGEKIDHIQTQVDKLVEWAMGPSK